MDMMVLHRKAVQYIAEHNCFDQIFTSEQLDAIGEQIKSNDEFPRATELYCHIIERTRSNLSTLTTGLDFILKNTQGQPKQDLINKLRDINNVGGVFEVVLIGALYRQFKENLDVYPLIENNKRAEAKLTFDNNTVCIEATVLNFSQEDQVLFNGARRNGGVSICSARGTGEGRIIQKIEDKFKRYSSNSLNVLVVSQYSCLPFENCGIEAITDFLRENGDTEPNCCWGGVFYFDRFECKQWIENTNCPDNFKISCDLVDELRQAFQVMRPCSS